MSFTGHLSYNKKPATPKSKRSSSPDSLQKTLTRPGSACLINKCLHRLLGEPIRCHGSLSRKAELLEKNQDKWKEKAQAWEKEKKSYCSALENVSLIQLSKNSADFYKEHLQNWNDSRNLKGKEGNLEAVIEWIKRQDEGVLMKIREVVGEKFEKMDSEKTETMDECLKELADKNEQLSKALFQIESELKSKAEGVHILKSKLERLKSEINEKDLALLEEKAINEALLQKSNQLQNDFHLNELKEELENKDLEIMLLRTQNTQLQCSILQFQQSNEVYIKTIEDLTKKLQNVRIANYTDDDKSFEALSSLEELESFDEDKEEQEKGSNRVSVNRDKQENGEFFQYFQCMALAIEEVLTNQRNPSN